jgi:hypothetical protein
MINTIHDYMIWTKENGYDQIGAQAQYFYDFINKYGDPLFGQYYLYKGDLFSIALGECIKYINYDLNGIKESFVIRYAMVMQNPLIRHDSDILDLIKGLIGVPQKEYSLDAIDNDFGKQMLRKIYVQRTNKLLGTSYTYDDLYQRGDNDFLFERLDVYVISDLFINNAMSLLAQSPYLQFQCQEKKEDFTILYGKYLDKLFSRMPKTIL